MKNDIKEVLISEEEILNKVKEIGEKVSKDYGISIIHSKEEVQTDYDLVVQLVNHNVFNEMGFTDATFIKLKDLL